MLILGRKKEQELVLNCPDNLQILIKVVRVQNGSVQLGITAPMSCNVVRKELLNNKKENHGSE